MIIHYLNLSDVDVMIIHYLNLSDVDVMIINDLNLSDVSHHWGGSDINIITGSIVTLVVGSFYYW
jgi:hypothetical protein